MKKYFFNTLISSLFVVSLAFGDTKKISDIQYENNTDKTQNVNIDLNSQIERTKILFLEPCNVTKVAYTESIDNIIAGTDVQERYSSMSPIQKNLIEKLFIKLRKNLNSIRIFDLMYQNDVCHDIDEYIFNNNESIEDYILNTYDTKNDYIITNNLTFTDEGKIKLKLFIWDTLDKRIVGAQYYIINENTLSRISNIISDFIYINTTTEANGIFDSKIVYVAETGAVTNRKKVVKIMDFNGDDNQKITDGEGIIITPTFSKINKDEIFYLEYKNRKATFYKENIKTKQKNPIKVNEGIMFAPSFNPQDSNQMILSIANEKGTNLFLLDMSVKKYSKITDNKFINTSPTFSPDGNQIVYVSDKTGSKKLHIHDIDTRESKQISKNNGIYDKPSWSPDGKLIAFVKMEKGRFKLGLMTPDGENERFITEAFLIEGLKWSPNSRYIMFSKQISPYGSGSIPSLYMIDILTNSEILINTPKNEGAVDPDWTSL